ncbi:MAG: serine protease [Bacteroidia bacterium]|nr:serine protease [Bacteroidia bacterium]
MKTIRLIIFILTIVSCNQKPEIVIESWMDKQQSLWPNFALTNNISFTDTTFTDIANSFLVDTGVDTLGVSCKHLFMVFENHLGIKNIDLGEGFKSWNLYPKNSREDTIAVKTLLNKNPDENIGQFNTLKVRDWIVFEIESGNSNLYPLKIRYTPIKTNEIVYAVGWGSKQKDNSEPVVQKFQCIDNLGDYYYLKSLTPDIEPHGRSGSPVIDKNGYLVGIVSGAEGNLTVFGSVSYLRTVFNKHKIEYIVK